MVISLFQTKLQIIDTSSQTNFSRLFHVKPMIDEISGKYRFQVIFDLLLCMYWCHMANMPETQVCGHTCPHYLILVNNIVRCGRAEKPSALVRAYLPEI